MEAINNFISDFNKKVVLPILRQLRRGRHKTMGKKGLSNEEGSLTLEDFHLEITEKSKSITLKSDDPKSTDKWTNLIRGKLTYKLINPVLTSFQKKYPDLKIQIHFPKIIP